MRRSMKASAGSVKAHASATVPVASHPAQWPSQEAIATTTRPLIIDLVRGAWVRYVRRTNADVFQDLEELHEFLFGREREDLSEVRPLLQELHHGACFYCGGALRSGDFDVDHFVPWSRSPLDLVNNFVPAHRTCNGRKSDHLAAEVHLARWCDRNHRHGVDLAAFCDGHALRHDARVSLAIAQSAYEAVDQQHGRVWLAGDRFEPLGQAWRGLLRAA